MISFLSLFSSIFKENYNTAKFFFSNPQMDLKKWEKKTKKITHIQNKRLEK